MHHILIYHHQKCVKTYFTRGLLEATRIPVFYGTAKVHKPITPDVKFRPINSQCGSLSALVSTYLDVQLQPLTTSMPAYLKNSQDLLQSLQRLPTLPPSTKLFTSDATSMYTNINPNEGLPTIEKYLNKYKHECNSLPPIQFLMQLLTLVMKVNVFTFGNTWWTQLIGTAMGTPCACIYATIFYSWFERTYLLPKYHHHLLLYKRQIDDIFGVSTPSRHSKLTYKDFTNDLNKVSNLNWKSSNLLSSVNFLDLTITLQDNGTITTKTYQKKENLFLYIPPQSAHPPGMIKSLIYNLLRTYFIQNTTTSDFQHTVQRFYKRLLDRGYTTSTIHPIFSKYLPKIISDPTILSLKDYNYSNIHPPSSKPSTTDSERQFFHLEFHPKDISRNRIQQLYKTHCNLPDKDNNSFLTGYENKHGNLMKINKLTIAYSRPKNLQDHLCPSKLPTPPSLPSITSYINTTLYKNLTHHPTT